MQTRVCGFLNVSEFYSICIHLLCERVCVCVKECRHICHKLTQRQSGGNKCHTILNSSKLKTTELINNASDLLAIHFSLLGVCETNIGHWRFFPLSHSS